MRQLLPAAVELQRQSIFHRDLKLENLLVETAAEVPHVRLIDFGLSCFANQQSQFHEFYGKWSTFFFFSCLPVWTLMWF